MILKEVRWNGVFANSFQIVDNKCYYKKDGDKIDFSIRVMKVPDERISNGILYLNKDRSYFDEETDTLVMRSLYHYKVIGEDRDTISIT